MMKETAPFRDPQIRVKEKLSPPATAPVIVGITRLALAARRLAGCNACLLFIVAKRAAFGLLAPMLAKAGRVFADGIGSARVAPKHKPVGMALHRVDVPLLVQLSNLIRLGRNAGA